MQNFNDYVKNGDGMNEDVYQKVKGIADKFDGKSQSDLLKAIYKEAEKGKKAGTLKNSDIDAFASTLSPFLDEKKRKMLERLVEDLKKI